jgi:hypothetical protein
VRRAHLLRHRGTGQRGGEHIHRPHADDLREQRRAGRELAVRPQGIEQHAALSTHGEAEHLLCSGSVRGLQRGEDGMVVDAEHHVDVRVRGEGVQRRIEGDVETAASVDAPGPQRALEGLGEPFDEAVAAAAGVGQALERHQQHPGRRQSAGQQPAGAAAELPSDREVVGPDVDATVLLRGFGQERDPPTARHRPQRVGAAALDRRQHDGVDVADLVRDRGPGRLGLAGAAQPGDVPVGPADEAALGQFGDVAPDRHGGDPAEPARQFPERQRVAFVEQGQDLVVPVRPDHSRRHASLSAKPSRPRASNLIKQKGRSTLNMIISIESRIRSVLSDDRRCPPGRRCAAGGGGVIPHSGPVGRGRNVGRRFNR